MPELLIQNASLYMGHGVILPGRNVSVIGDRIAEISCCTGHETDGRGGEEKPAQAGTVLDAGGRLLVPPFMDTHMHIDKSYTMMDDDTPSLIAACDNSEKCSDLYYGWSDEQILEEILSHAGRVVEQCIVHGTLLLRTNLLFTPSWKTLALTAMQQLKQAYKGRFTIQNCVAFDVPWRQELLDAAADGRIEVVGGYPHLTPDYRSDVDDAFSIAEEYGLPLDLHCDESDTDSLDCFDYIVRRTQETGMQGKVTCGHVTGLNSSMMSEEKAARSIAAAAAAGVGVTSLTSCNMYLMNRTRRGPTRLRQLSEAGVNVAVASDNVQDTFRPFGNCDLLEEALLTAQVHKLSTQEWYGRVLDMVTWNAAKTAQVKDYGLSEGCRADFVLLDAATPGEALMNLPAGRLVFCGGRLIARDGHLVP